MFLRLQIAQSAPPLLTRGSLRARDTGIAVFGSWVYLRPRELEYAYRRQTHTNTQSTEPDKVRCWLTPWVDMWQGRRSQSSGYAPGPARYSGPSAVMDSTLSSTLPRANSPTHSMARPSHHLNTCQHALRRYGHR